MPLILYFSSQVHGITTVSLNEMTVIVIVINSGIFYGPIETCFWFGFRLRLAINGQATSSRSLVLWILHISILYMP